MAGKKALVRKVMLGFHRSFANASAEFDKLVTEGRLDDALRLTHTLKGLAATLEAAALTEAAAKLEDALLNHRTDEVRSLVDAVKVELAPALAAASQVALPAVASPVSAPITAPSIDHSEVRRLADELRALLAKNSAKSRKLLTPLREALTGSPLASHLDALTAHLDRFDFRGADAALTAFTADLSSSEPKP